jgi:DNA-binding transcriptional MerR regulator
MEAGEVIKKLEGLTHDKLTYFVRAGYLKPSKKKRGILYYNDFSENDFLILTKAWQYIRLYDMRTRSAFEKAQLDLLDPQMRLF